MSSATNSAIYSTVEEARALFPWLAAKDAVALCRRSQTILDHGLTEPEGVAELEDREKWVEEGSSRLVSHEHDRV
jgi:hypothetical protein